ncbi:MAG: DUF3467 domain-containing protein [Candidatus Aenigmarchaeota archaeon]|nr:DUF3467 domain-containing protein [Candidatus Aenigmarchaeota archaeon]
MVIIAERQQINIRIDHSDEGFYTDSISVVYNPNKFILDFKQTVPKIDQVEGKSQQTIVVKHKTMLLDAKFAKIFLKTLQNAMDGYEKKYGKIELPKKQKQKEEAVVVKEESYIG